MYDYDGIYAAALFFLFWGAIIVAIGYAIAAARRRYLKWKNPPQHTRWGRES